MNYHSRSDSHISFIREGKKRYRAAYNKKNGPRSLYLLDDSYQLDILDIIPRLFTLTTNSGSYKFNTEILKDTSSVIMKFLKENPTNLQYHIDIKDEENVLKKIEEMYRGKLVIFDEDELPISKKFTNILNIKCCPNYMKPESLKCQEGNSEYGLGLNDGVGMSIESLNSFIENKSNRTFSITTKNNKYQVNYFGLFYSKILRDIVIKDPETKEYFYDYDDEFGEFQSVCDLLNFEIVNVTINNVYSMKEIVEDLQIEFVLEKINKNIEEFEQVSQKIDDNQMVVDSIEEVFAWLYNIKENSVEFVKNSIYDSFWSKSEEDVHELAAFILQVIKTDFSYHSYLIDLLIELDKEADETNFLDLLMPFIIDKLIFSFNNSLIKSSFIYNLYKRGIIPKDEIFEQLKTQYRQSNYDFSSVGKYYYMNNSNINLWFLPELIELNLINLDDMMGLNNRSHSASENPINFFIQKYYPDKIDMFKKMRDSGDPDDEITKSLRNDDVDTLQAIITRHKIDISSTNVSYNIFEKFVANGETNLINYAAAYGSIKCFKYLLLNHAKLNDFTFSYAVYGGNIEIIKIVDQKKSENISSKNKLKNNYSPYSESNAPNGITPSIMKHQNALFDWILQEKFANKGKIEKSIQILTKSLAENGNAHSFIEIVDKGIDLTIYFKEMIQTAAKNGFYRLTQLIWNIIGKKKINGLEAEFEAEGIPMYNRRRYDMNSFDKSYFVSFGNLSIFKLSLQLSNSQVDLENALFCAVEKKYINIIKYFFEILVKKDFKITRNVVFETLNNSLDIKDSFDFFNYFFDQYKTSYSFVFKNVEDLIKLLYKACSIPSLEVVKKLTDLILSEDKKEDLTTSFLRAAMSKSVEICQFFVEKNVFIDYEKISSSLSKLSTVSYEILTIIIENSSPEVKNTILMFHLYPAIKNCNKELVEFLLSMNAPSENALIEASLSNEIDMVNIVLKHNNKPSFINLLTNIGTALSIAAENNNLSIVNLLLSYKGIDPSIANKKGKTPLIIAVLNLNLDIINAILDFYGDDIQSQIWQIDEALKVLLNSVFSIPNSYSDCIVNHISNAETNENNIKVVKRFLEIENINPNCYGDYYTLLTFACKIKDINIIKNLLNNKRIDVNKYAPKVGFTPLMSAIASENTEIAKLLIEDHRTNINFRSSNGDTALIIAVENELIEIVDLLIQNENFDPEESQLNYSFYLSSKEISKKLFELKSLDVNYSLIKYKNDSYVDINSYRNDFEYSRIYSYETSLTNAVNMNNIEMVDLIIQHHSFDKVKSLLKKAIFITAENDYIDIFRKLIQFENDVNIHTLTKNMFESAVVCRSKKIITEILQNPTFDSEKNDLLNVFIEASNNLGFYKRDINQRMHINRQDNDNNTDNNDQEMIEIMNEIYDYDQQHKKLIDFNKLLPNGKSFFTNKKDPSHEKEYVKFFIDHGADPNLPDKNCVYPLEHAIQMGSLQYILSLIDSEKIDFSMKIPTKPLLIQNDEINQNDAKYKTYLHLAARSENFKLFDEFLNKDLIDVNVTDDLGETPLMEAVRFRKTENIKILFRRDDLDFLHCNNKGEDALKIITDSVSPNENESPTDKNQYCHSLVMKLEFSLNNRYNYVSRYNDRSIGSDIEIKMGIDDEENYRLIYGSKYVFEGNYENVDFDYFDDDDDDDDSF